MIDLSDVIGLEDKTAEELQEESSKVAGALLGYAKIDILEMDLTFGRWNLRKVVDKEVKKLVQSMKVERIQRYLTKNLIPLAVSMDDIDPTSLTMSGGGGGDEFSLLRFNEDVDVVQMFACGGQHRRAALQSIRDELVNEVDAVSALLVKEREQLQRGKVDPESVASIEDQLTEKKRRLKMFGMWGVAVYDLGMLYV